MAKLRLWLEDRTLTLVEALPLHPRLAHRQLLLRLRTALRADAPPEARRALALDLCKVLRRRAARTDRRGLARVLVQVQGGGGGPWSASLGATLGPSVGGKGRGGA